MAMGPVTAIRLTPATATRYTAMAMAPVTAIRLMAMPMAMISTAPLGVAVGKEPD